jgi:hypothetical protein
MVSGEPYRQPEDDKREMTLYKTDGGSTDNTATLTRVEVALEAHLFSCDRTSLRAVDLKAKTEYVVT